MRISIPIRAKLTVAAVALLLQFGISLFLRKGTQGTSEILFNAAVFVFAAFLCFGGVFSNWRLQVLWGWMSLIAVVTFLAALCLGPIAGSALWWWMVAGLAAALVGGYLLLMDSDVRAYRETLPRKLTAK